MTKFKIIILVTVGILVIGGNGNIGEFYGAEEIYIFEFYVSRRFRKFKVFGSKSFFFQKKKVF